MVTKHKTLDNDMNIMDKMQGNIEPLTLTRNQLKLLMFVQIETFKVPRNAGPSLD